MDARIIFFLLGRMALLEGAALLLAFVLTFLWEDARPLAFGLPAALSLVLWRVFSHYGKGHRHAIGVTDGAVYLFAAWLLNSFLGALPFFLTGELSAADAFFASVAAFTPTALLFTPTGLDSSRGFWQIFQGWIGGLHFLCLLVTVMPQVGGCFGMTLSARQRTNFSPQLRRMNAAAYKMARRRDLPVERRARADFHIDLGTRPARHGSRRDRPADGACRVRVDAVCRRELPPLAARGGEARPAHAFR